MKTKLSALIDGELDTSEMRDVCVSLRRDEDLRRTGTTYILIGDALRGEPHLATEMSETVLDHLADEPVVLAPRGVPGPWRERGDWQRSLMALAATAAAVAAVAWFGLPARNGQPQLVEQKPVVLAASDADMQEYLIAHVIHSGSAYLSGDAQQIRTVSLNGAEPRR